MGNMALGDLAASLRESLQDAASVFNSPDDGDFKRHLQLAALDFARARPRTLLGEVTLVADQFNYPAPTDLLQFKSALWGIDRKSQPWEKAWPGRLPDVRVSSTAGVRELHFFPPPTAQQIALLGSSYKFWYFAAHAVGETDSGTTVAPGDRGLLMLRAQAEACKEMALRNMGKPVQMRDGASGSPRNGTPAALHEQLMDQFDMRIQ